jgi:hypothetical protein
VTPRQQLDTKGAASALGWKPETVTRYNQPDRRERYGFPEPDGYVSGRPWWWDTTIRQFKKSMRGKGAGAGRPAKKRS